jgi:hypothetical protein
MWRRPKHKFYVGLFTMKWNNLFESKIKKQNCFFNSLFFARTWMMRNEDEQWISLFLSPIPFSRHKDCFILITVLLKTILRMAKLQNDIEWHNRFQEWMDWIRRRNKKKLLEEGAILFSYWARYVQESTFLKFGIIL